MPSMWAHATLVPGSSIVGRGPSLIPGASVYDLRMTASRWEHFDHGADIGVRGVGPTLAAAFEQLAIALTAVVTDPAAVEALTTVEVRCEARDAETLAVEWLNALVFEMSTRRMLFGKYRVATDGCHLQGLAFGEPVDRERHHPAVEVKGATFTALAVARQDDGSWLVQCVVDV